MTREEEIRNAIDEIFPIPHSGKGRTYGQAMMATGFEAGVKWADANPKSPWISVFDSLPCNHKELIDNDISTVMVFVKTKYSVGTDYMRLYMDSTWRWESYHDITHWMPIPEPPKN